MVLRAVSVGATLVLVACVFSLGCIRASRVTAPTIVTVSAVRGQGLSTDGFEPDYGGTWKPKDEVEVEWRGSWWPAVVLEKRGGKWLVHYEGYTADWDEVVGGDRIRERRVEVEPETPKDDDIDPDP